MSIYKYDSAQDELVPIAGQGKAEYGASTVRSGTVTFSIDPQAYATLSVTFDTPMPDADYLVDVSFPTQQPIQYYVVNDRTKNGFNLFIKNEGAGSTNASVTYTAFKLYTDTEYNNLLNNAVLTSDVTDAVEEDNMNPVTSNAVAGLKKIKIATPTFATGVTGTAQYHWQRNECTVLMQGVHVPAGFIFNNDFITNLPQAATNAIVQYGTLYVLVGDSGNNRWVGLTNIVAGGTALKADGNIGAASDTVHIYGSFTYRTKDWYEGE